MEGLIFGILRYIYSYLNLKGFFKSQFSTDVHLFSYFFPSFFI